MKKQKITLFLLCIFSLFVTHLKAESIPDDILKMVKDIELPGGKIDSLLVDMHMRLPDTVAHLFCRLRYKAPESFSLQIFDGHDSTPLLIIIDQLALINDPFAEQLSVIASAGVTFDFVPTDKQYNAVFAFNTPVDGQVNNKIRLDFKTMFSRLSENFEINTGSGSKIIFSGMTKESSRCKGVFDTKATIPLHALSMFIEGSDVPVIEFSRIECEVSEPEPAFPLQQLQQLRLVTKPIKPEGFIDSIFAMNALLKAVFTRAAIYRPEIREKVSEMFSLKDFDWQSLTERDARRSEMLRELFPQGATQ